MLLLNWKSVPDGFTIALGNTNVKPVQFITYLGLPIGSTLKTTRRLLIDHLQKRIGFAYSKIVSNKLRCNRKVLARLYNAIVLPYFLYLSPFWRIFPDCDKRKLRSVFFKYAKFLLRLPLWSRNSFSY